MCTEIIRSDTKQVTSTILPNELGPITTLGFERTVACTCGTRVETAMVLMIGRTGGAPLVRIHSQCITGDVFGSLRCDCGEQLKHAMSMIRAEGAGIVIYEQQEGRGIGLMGKLCAYALQDQGFDTVQANQCLGFPADCRDYLLPVEILRHIGVTKLRLLSNNPQKLQALQRGGIKVVELIPCEVTPNVFSTEYLRTKKRKLGHQLTRV
jgi:3,4-dihydroxy 2-butanone 4-phosphate synthase/GTP cyclohydrolase II